MYKAQAGMYLVEPAWLSCKAYYLYLTRNRGKDHADCSIQPLGICFCNSADRFLSQSCQRSVLIYTSSRFQRFIPITNYILPCPVSNASTFELPFGPTTTSSNTSVVWNHRGWVVYARRRVVPSLLLLCLALTLSGRLPLNHGRSTFFCHL